MRDAFASVEGFDWDAGNLEKNWKKHSVESRECEEAFLDRFLVVTEDLYHSIRGSRHILLGKTFHGRLLYVVFTIRNKKIRVISARDLNKKEYTFYEKPDTISEVQK